MRYRIGLAPEEHSAELRGEQEIDCRMASSHYNIPSATKLRVGFRGKLPTKLCLAKPNTNY